MKKTIYFRSAFSISYELKNKNSNNQEFQKKFIEFLFLNKCIGMKSYIPNTITFMHDEERKFSELSKSIKKYFSYLVYYQFSEITIKHTCDGIDCEFSPIETYEIEFDELVNQIQEGIIE